MKAPWQWLAAGMAAMAVGALLGALLAAPVLAQGKRVTRPDYSGLAKGAEVTSGGETYVFLPEVRAAPGLRRGESGAQALTRMNLAGRTPMGEKGRFVLYREQGGGGATALKAPLPGAAAYPVVLNSRTGDLTIVQGEIKVFLKEPADAEALAEAHKLTLTNRFDHLKLAMYRPAEGNDLVAALTALRGDGRVASADLELLEHVLSPN